ncbi:MAG: hypothetical protein ABIS50_10445 [Luteolibacter sp.]|uniref:hypothetical protein n=1 Tax=Luteolibacter sp. TaxID=1962973 RepID=UPI0032634BDC
MNSHFLIGQFLYQVTVVLIAISLLVFALTRSSSSNRPVVRPDHFHRLVRRLAALVAVGAVAATAIGTWRGTSGVVRADAFEVTVPTRPAPLIAKAPDNRSLDIGPTKLIGTVIVARRVGSRYFPLHGESRVVEGQAGYLMSLKFDSTWKDYHYTVSIQTENFYHKDGVLNSQGGLYINMNGPGGSDKSSVVTIPNRHVDHESFPRWPRLDPSAYVPCPGGRQGKSLSSHPPRAF